MHTDVCQRTRALTRDTDIVNKFSASVLKYFRTVEMFQT